MGAAFAPWRERTAFADPVALGVLSGPAVEYVDFLFAQTRCVLGSDVLQDVVVVLGDPEDLWLGLGDVPRDIDVEGTEEPNEGMPHERNTATLGRAVEEGNLNAVVLQRLGVLERSFPGRFLVDGLPIVVFDCELGACVTVNFDLVALCGHNKSGLMRRAKVPIRYQLHAAIPDHDMKLTLTPSVPWNPPLHRQAQSVHPSCRAAALAPDRS